MKHTMEEGDGLVKLKEYLMGAIHSWVDSELLRMQFSDDVIRAAVEWGLLAVNTVVSRKVGQTCYNILIGPARNLPAPELGTDINLSREQWEALSDVIELKNIGNTEGGTTYQSIQNPSIYMWHSDGYFYLSFDNSEEE